MIVRGILAAVAVPLLLLAGGCGGNGSTGPDPDPTYAELVTAGWTAFVDGDLSTAITRFTAAIAADATQAEPHSGIGWCRILQDAPAAADASFTAGSTLAGSNAARADLQAGWALVANVLKDPAGADVSNFSDSNTRIAAALALDANWSFPYLDDVDKSDLTVLQAANHFALGAFAASLTSVQVLDAGFIADVGTTDGVAALAGKIEALRAAGGALLARPAFARITGNGGAR